MKLIVNICSDPKVAFLKFILPVKYKHTLKVLAVDKLIQVMALGTENVVFII